LGVPIACCIACCVASTRLASAGAAQEYAQLGEALARDGKLNDAISAFKTADRLESHARNACLIALAYIRAARWTQAELFLARCRERGRPDDPPPDWLPLAEQELRAGIAKARLAKIAITVEPVGTPAVITMAGFASDEQFAARNLRLPLGRHVITAMAPGRESVQVTFEITDTSVRHVLVKFPAKDAPRAPLEHSRVPMLVAALGGAAVVGGIAYHMFELRPVRDELIAASDAASPDPARYDRYSAVFDQRRVVTYSLYGIGAAAVLTGLVLHYTAYRDAPDKAPRISAQVGGGGAAIALEWQR
jgi:hypothetical protein